MHLDLYILLLIYFILGAMAIFFINQRRTPPERKNNWLKFTTYFIMISLLFFSISIRILPIISLIIIISGCMEIFMLMFKTKQVLTGILALAVFSGVFYSFYLFSFLEQSYLYFTLFIVAVFDAFSQLTGQSLGKRKLVPTISPDKTVEGLAGGLIMAGLTAVAIRNAFSSVSGLSSPIPLLPFPFSLLPFPFSRFRSPAYPNP